jgi:hypothetical protein
MQKESPVVYTSDTMASAPPARPAAAAAAPQTYRIIVANPAFPHAFGRVLETDVTTEQNAILLTLKLWRKGKLPVTCLEQFLDLVAPDFVRECYENPSGLEEGEEEAPSSSSSEAAPATEEGEEGAEEAEEGEDAAMGGNEDAERIGTAEPEPEEDEPGLVSPWNPFLMTSALKKKIILKVKDLVASKDLRAVFLRLLEKQPSPVLLIMPGATTHMAALLNIIQCLSAAVPSGDDEDDDL